MQEYTEYAQNQGYYMNAETMSSLSSRERLFMMFPAGGVARFDDWLANISSLRTSREHKFFDCEHNGLWDGKRAKGNSAGPDCPVLLKHGVIMMVNKTRTEDWTMVVSSEHFAIMGWHMHDVPHSSFPRSPLADKLASLTASQKKKCQLPHLHP